MAEMRNLGCDELFVHFYVEGMNKCLVLLIHGLVRRLRHHG